jgi:phasin family protein
MNRKNTFSSTASPVNADDVQALANIYLGSAERLAELNLNVIREVVEESVTATKDYLGKGADNGSGFSQATFLQPMVDKSLTYSRNAFAILVETQQEASKMLMSLFSGAAATYKLPTDWNSPLEMFNKGVQQFSTLATQGASVTNDVARKAAESFTKATKAA